MCVPRRMTTITTFSQLTLLTVVCVCAIVHPKDSDRSTLCDMDLCSCPGNLWGKVTCACNSVQDELVLRSAGAFHVPAHVTVLTVEGCSHVHVVTGAFQQETLRAVTLRHIARLVLSPDLFNGSRREDTVLEVRVEHSGIPVIPSYAFRGHVHTVRLQGVHVNAVEAFAFTSVSTSMEELLLADSRVDTVEPQAFKKLNVASLNVASTSFTNALPSRAFMDVRVHSHFTLNAVNASMVSSHAFTVIDPFNVLIASCNVVHLQGEAFKVTAGHAVTVRDNTFTHVEDGAFMGFSASSPERRSQARPVLTFSDNTINTFGPSSLAFNATALTVHVQHIYVSRPCQCDALPMWRSHLQLPLHQIYCLRGHDTGGGYVDASTDAACHSHMAGMSNVVVTLVVVVAVVILSIVGVVVVMGVRTMRRKRRRRRKTESWLDLPSSAGVAAGVNKGLVLPEGRTYRETELHVIVEKAEPLIMDS